MRNLPTGKYGPRRLTHFALEQEARVDKGTRRTGPLSRWFVGCCNRWCRDEIGQTPPLSWCACILTIVMCSLVLLSFHDNATYCAILQTYFQTARMKSFVGENFRYDSCGALASRLMMFLNDRYSRSNQSTIVIVAIASLASVSLLSRHRQESLGLPMEATIECVVFD